MPRDTLSTRPGIRDGWNYYLARQLQTFPIYVNTSHRSRSWSLPDHRQPGVEINITHAGRAHLFVNGHGYPQWDRHVAAFSGTCTHSFSTDPCSRYRRTVICIDETLFHALLRARGVTVRPGALAAIHHDYYDFALGARQWSWIEWLTNDLVRTFEEGGPWWQQIVSAQTAELVATLFMGLEDDCVPRAPEKDWLDHCLRYVEQNLDQDLTLEKVARRFYVSPEHLTRTFRKTYGLSFMRYVQRERIRLACKLLDEGEWSVADVAGAVGFVSRSHFHRVFRHTMGITPTDYRSRVKSTRSPESTSH
ncbi:MAG: helix-turn-helix transcriptional regulator [Firmicutes bacterium]|nr:helix-turn-helix transcriptional regulator [Bacillota bacterium]